MEKHYICNCFYTRNIFIKRLNIHFEYLDKGQFLTTYQQVLKKMGIVDEKEKEAVVADIENEITRRQNLGKDYLARKKTIAQCYRQKHPDIFNLKNQYLAGEFLSLIDYCKNKDATFEGACANLTETIIERAYAMPVFTAEFCRLFLEEIENFENSDCPKGRPNTMNRYGVLLDELGFDPFITELRQGYLQPLSKLLFPDWGGGKLDSHKAFIVQYREDEDVDLSYHYDNAEVTLNVPLSTAESYTGGNLYFGPMRTEEQHSNFKEYEHRPTIGLLHRGQHKHGAQAITSGARYNLIIWMRSSKVRNKLCPMCDRKPDLVETVGRGDGFTRPDQKIVDVCSVD